MIAHQPIDITAKTDECANALLCAFDTPVRTGAGVIAPAGTAFTLTLNDGKVREFATASGAIEVLRRNTP